MIADAVLREVVRADLLGAFARAHLRAALTLLRAALAVDLHLIQPRHQNLPGANAVLKLAALVLHRHHQPGGDVRHAHRAVGGVDGLAARAAAAIDIDAHIVHVELHVHLIHLREHRHGDGAGVHAALALGLGDALHAVHAALELEAAEGAFPAHLEADFLEAADAGLALVDHLDLPAAAAGVVAVHAEEIRREQPRLITAGAGADFHDDVLVVAGVPGQQQHAQAFLQRGGAGGERLELLLRHCAQLSIALHLQHLARLVKLVALAAVGAVGLDDLGQAGTLATEIGHARVVRRDFRIAQQAVQFVETRFNLGELVKHTHGE